MDRQTAVTTLTGLRAVVGGASWLTPRLGGRLFGLDPAGNPQSPYVGRLFGARDVALAVGAAQSSGAAQDQWLQIGAACDAADLAAGLMGGMRGYLSPMATVLVSAGALAALGLGVMALRDDSQQPAA